ncbi:Rv1733c family protein [Paractinoplanes toevensis]|nr:hypothetical protein [Actinoplanes toevensis]
MRRLAARLCWGWNPLRRREDRIEGWLNVVLLLLLAVVGSSLAGHAARTSYREQARVSAWERQHRFEVWAVLLSAPSPAAAARWKAPDGTPRTGALIVGPEMQTGAWVTIWVDEKGTVAAPPTRRSPVTAAVEMAVAVVLALALGLLAIRFLGRFLLDRRRMRDWQREWLEVGPRWSRYR